PAVWTTCMLFFQTLLFAGYLYAHLLATRLPVHSQLSVHGLLLLIAAVLVQLQPDPSWKPVDSSVPIPRILLLLSLTAGLPYFVLSATSPLLLRWLTLSAPGTSPHRLYALSNAGSLAALLAYPALLEPLFPLSIQTATFNGTFRLFAICCGLCLVRMFRSTARSRRAVAIPPPAFNRSPDASLRPPGTTPPSLTRWLTLSCLASVMLLAGTSEICQDVAVIPFLWIAPLTLYLLSFILCFESDRWYRRGLYAPLTATIIPILGWLHLFGTRLHFIVQLAPWLIGLFCIFMLCHGELARLRPGPQRLTLFYLTLAAGGAAGGLLCAVVAPLLLPALWEHHLGLLASALLATWIWFDQRGWLRHNTRPPLTAATAAIVVIACVLLDLASSLTEYAESIASRRNFYGVLRIENYADEDAVLMKHGRIVHGLQFRSLPAVPTMYYGYQSGVGRAITALRERIDQPGTGLRIGLVGLGTGTLAAWGRPADNLVFYEINPDVIRLAKEHFRFLRDSQATVEIVEGDARLALEFEPPRDFDLLVLDAFSGDAIPIHLLTREALDVCRRHLKPQGILACHISNVHFDLARVTTGLADAAGMACLQWDDPPVADENDGRPKISAPGSRWTLLANSPEILQADVLQSPAALPPPESRVVWTDDHSHLLQVLDFAETSRSGQSSPR
ncbi:MAG: spermidine synthase, partial [Planctomycetota bacterium]